MGITTINKIENRTSLSVQLFNLENPTMSGSGSVIPAGHTLGVNMWIPWASSSDFPRKHLRLDILGGDRFWIWQALNADGDHVRFSTDSAWHDRAEPVDGISAVGGSRTLVVLDGGGFQLVDIPQDWLDLSPAFDSGIQMVSSIDRRPVPSVPRLSAAAFSMAGFASDTRTCLYRDSGKRYEFRIENGVALAIHPDGRRAELRQAVSYNTKRAGERHPAPPFDLIAASGGRVLAKARGDDRLYFATMDDLFIHCTGDERIPVPSAYFKLDPEANQPGARTEDLTAHLRGWFRNHPGAERWPLFRALFEQEVADMMIVRVEPGIWHLIDPRPSAAPSLLLAGLIAAASAIDGLVSVDLPPALDTFERKMREVKAELDRLILSARETDDAPPTTVPTYEHVCYRDNSGSQFELSSINYRRILDIGVGHLHHHDQYERVTGGELQPVRLSDVFADLYRFFNGPVRDGDGYIDGTANYYALVELGEPATTDDHGYALLYQDEQTYFSKRWRLVGPDDGGRLLFSLAADLTRPLYTFDPDAYWCPFQAGLIGPKSRLAVAAQVLLVTGDADRPATRSQIYSTNFSWSSMDRTWRWRQLPLSAEVRYLGAAAETAGTEPIADSGGDSVYPQTLRLREDMTLHLKGTRRRPGGQGAEKGRWYQRYLPSSNRLLPATKLTPGVLPKAGYSHPWKWLPESVFQLADHFSHFGVYDVVDSRTQYYVVQPANDGDARALVDAVDTPWVDHDYRLYRWAPKFSWAAPRHFLTPSNLVSGACDRRPPSLYNRDTRLRIVRRGSRWIAMHFDKRDDDLLPFEGLPVQLALSGGGHRVTVTLSSNTWLEEPPAIERVEFRWTGVPGSSAAIALFPHRGQSLANLWRLRMAALVPGSSGEVVELLDAHILGNLKSLSPEAGFEYEWTPKHEAVEDLRRYCSPTGALDYGTSVWFEDIVGHVSVPDRVQWGRALVTATPSPITLGAPTRTVIHCDIAGRAIINNFNAFNLPVRHEVRTGVPIEITFRRGISRLLGAPMPAPEGIGGAELPEPIEEPESVLPSGMVLPDDDSLASVPIPFVFVEPDAAFVAQTVPTSMIAGRMTNVSVTFRNTGDVAWTASGGFGLGAQNPQDNRTWGRARVTVPATVVPGAEIVFRFTVTAPASPGSYNFQWRPVQESVRWFGATTPNVVVSVRALDTSALRESVRREAYFIWRDRLRRGVRGDARGDWFAARAKLGVPTDLYL